MAGAKGARWAATAGALGLSMVLAACGGGSKGSGSGGVTSQSPQQAVQSAVSKLGAQSDVKMVLSLPITADQAKQLSSKGGGKPMTDAEANALSTGSIFLNVATGGGEPLDSTQAQTDPKNSLDFGLEIGRDTPLEVVYVNQNLYARAQVKQLLTDVGQDPAQASQFASQLNSLETYVPGISHLGSGDWVEIDHAGLQSLAPLLKQIESQSGTSLDPSTLKADIMALRSKLLAAVEANSTFKSTGTDQYSVTVQVASLLATVKSDIQQANIPQLGAQIAKALGEAQAKVPAGQTAVIDVKTSDGRLSQAQVNLNQFAGSDKVDFSVPLTVAFSSPGAPQAPSGATLLNVSKLPALLGALLGNQNSA